MLEDTKARKKKIIFGASLKVQTCRNLHKMVRSCWIKMRPTSNMCIQKLTELVRTFFGRAKIETMIVSTSIYGEILNEI